MRLSTSDIKTGHRLEVSGSKNSFNSPDPGGDHEDMNLNRRRFKNFIMKFLSSLAIKMGKCPRLGSQRSLSFKRLSFL